MRWKTFLAAAFFAALATAAQAWDDTGHLLIAEIAAHRLGPEVIRKMEALTPLLDPRFNGGRPYNILTAAAWLDDMRGLGQANPWKTWHYVDAPCEGEAFIEPAPPHALWALDQAAEVLRNKNAEPKARAEALAQVMHIVGDIHQPLHTADRNDRGGNGVRIVPLKEESGPANLHAFWDAACRYDAVKGQIKELFRNPPLGARPLRMDEPGAVSQTARTLLAHQPKESVPSALRSPWREWARETHAIACKSGWPPADMPRENGAVALTPAFVHESHEIAMQQLLKAGVRLADLLNELLGDGPAE
ncbi:MAG: S1/P1 nuclease [Chthoniobacteraceae bacterium]|nr:S1/P1 nuclease [Chthoniobacteraceae bacterium]